MTRRCEECGTRERTEVVNMARPRAPTPEYRALCPDCYDEAKRQQKMKMQRERDRWRRENL